MVIRCIENISISLDKGTCVEVIEEKGNMYLIEYYNISNRGYWRQWFSKDKFEVIDTTIDDTKQTETETVDHPIHYNNGIEVWDYTDSWRMDFLEGNIIKYVTRYKYKNGVEDLKKAKQYIERLIEREGKEHGGTKK